MPTEKIAENNLPFLEKVKQEANLENVFEARDLSEIVYRTMRDLMPKETIDQVSSELHKQTIFTDNKTIQNEIADLWQDTNPIVAWLSRVRPPFKKEAPFGIDDNLFITRIEQEGAVPRGVTGETVIKAVFSATKEELSPESIKQIAEFLPGKIRKMWEIA